MTPLSRLLLCALLFAAAPDLFAQTLPEHGIFADRRYDAAVPTPTNALGYQLGRDLGSYGDWVPYLDRLARSNRVRVATHGVSSEGRALYNVTISSPENIARLAAIRADLARLADPRRLSTQDADAIIRRTPAVVMLVFATDGAETAATEAAIQLAYQLTAATDARTRAMLNDAVVIIVPAANPDANQRTVAWYKAFKVGPEGTADGDAAEHNFPWGINSNTHYQVDPNRESVWSVLPETRAMVALYRQWNPQVFVDNHGEHAQYTGPWYVEPLHEVLTAKQRLWHRIFGEAMQPEFAQRGYVYAPWEYGQFDPGYWDTYPNFSGAIAWTTETTGGGSRGLRIERRGGTHYTLADGIIQHLIASDVTIQVAAKQREQLLRDFLDYKRTAVTEGAAGAVKAYTLSADNDPHTLAAVVNTLRRNAIEVHRTTQAVTVRGARPFFEVGGDEQRTPRDVMLPAGSYVMSMAQPESRMLRVLLEPEAKFSSEFNARIAQLRAAADSGRAAGRLFYDITAWSMPHSYHLAGHELAEALPAAALELVTTDVQPRGTLTGVRGDAVLIDYSSNSAVQAVARLRRDSIVYRFAREPVTIEGRRFTGGSIAVFAADNPRHDLQLLARQLAEQNGIDVFGVARLEDSGFTRAATGRIAVVMDRPVSTTGFGHIWYTFEQRYGVDFTALNFDRLATVDLQKYDVLIVPDGNYGSLHPGVAADIAARLRTWVNTGGTLIGMRGGAAWIAAEERNLTAARMRRAPPRLPAVPGVVMRATVTNPRHPLLYGYDAAELPVLVWSALAFDPAARVDAPLRIVDAPRARVSGFVYPESLAHVAGTPYVVHDQRGTGNVVLFLDDPNFRLFWDGLTRMFFNAVFLTPRVLR